ncbi:MAG: HAD-IA family hydrolase [Methanosarcinales archaeon]|nr:HAD-IA family hydrolase [Methanosarcinales archaeon]
MNIRNIIFDFDGVILDSIPIKTKAFRELFSVYPTNIVDEFIEYHLQNGGVSRYEKIRYFYEKLLKKEILENEILDYANIYSKSTKEELANQKYLINDTLNCIKKNYKKYNMHIVSGADEQDLKYICDRLDISKYFMTINGSPIKKCEIIRTILNIYKYKKDETCLIGDSINDFEAAKSNGILFFGYNNTRLEYLNRYISTFDEFDWSKR